MKQEIVINELTETYKYVSSDEPSLLTRSEVKMKTLLMPEESFEEMLCRKMDELEDEGWTPTHALMWEPVYSYYERLLLERFKKEDFNLKFYVMKTYDLTINVIPLDDRKPQWLIELLIYVYQGVKE